MSEANKALAREWFERVWNEGDVAAIERLRAPSTVGYGLAPKKLEGIERYQEWVRSVRAALTDIHIDIEQIIAEGEHVAVRVSFRARRGERHFRMTGMGTMRIVDGRIAEAWNLWDVPSLLEGLGENTGVRTVGEAFARIALSPG